MEPSTPVRDVVSTIRISSLSVSSSGLSPIASSSTRHSRSVGTPIPVSSAPMASTSDMRLSYRFGTLSSPSIAGRLVHHLDALDPGLRQLVVDLRDESIESAFVLGFGSRDEHILRIRGTEEPPAVLSVDACAVRGVDVRAFG